MQPDALLPKALTFGLWVLLPALVAAGSAAALRRGGRRAQAAALAAGALLVLLGALTWSRPDVPGPRLLNASVAAVLAGLGLALAGGWGLARSEGS